MSALGATREAYVAIGAKYGTTTTRETGARARDEILELLRTQPQVTLDFVGTSVTPSFGDECVGGLARHLGREGFKQRVQLVNVSETDRPLLRHVIARRLAQSAAERARA